MPFLSKRFERQLITVASCGLTNLSFGLGFGWIAPALEHLTSDASSFVLGPEEVSWVASIYFAAEIFASLACGLFSNFIGRKPLIAIGTLLQAVSWVILIFARSAIVVILSRAMLGIAAGIFDITWSIYLGEITTPSERGFFGSVMIMLVIGGAMVEFLLSLVLSHVWLSVIPCIFSLTSLVMCFFMVEAPAFLITHENNQHAIENLAWLRGQDDVKNVQHEFDELTNYIERVKHQNNVLWKVFRYPKRHKVYIFCVIIFALAQLTGYMVVVSYQARILDRYTNIPDVKILTSIFGILLFAFVIVNMFVIETIGRRTLLLVGFVGCAMVQILTAFLFYCQDHHSLDLPFTPIIVIVLLNIYGVIFIICILPTIFVLKSELFPQKLKTVGSVSATVFNALAEFIVTKTFVSVTQNNGIYVNFAFYAVVDVVSVIYVYLLIPETKGKSLVQIQNELAAGPKKPTSPSPTPSFTGKYVSTTK